MKRTKPIVLLCMILLPFCASVPAQTSVSVIRGTALDSTGAVVVAAEIKLINLRTNLERTVQSNGNGDYEILDLQNGVYRLTADFPLFRVDHKLSDKNSLFFKYSYYYSPYVLPAGDLQSG